jgi:hypothetical protein
VHEIRAFFAKHTAAGRVVPMPEWLLEVLVIGPVAELPRRWLADPSVIQLELAQPMLTERIIASIRVPARKPAHRKSLRDQ